MRNAISQQLSLRPPEIDHNLCKELRAMDKRLGRLPTRVFERLLADLVGDRGSSAGRRGMAGEQVLRVNILKQRMGWSYATLHFHLLDSQTFRSFCLLGLDERTPSVGTLKRNCKALSEESLRQANDEVLRQAAEEGVEKGETLRADSTVMKSAIHHPTDSSLMSDAVRMLCQRLAKAKKFDKSIKSLKRTRKAKLLALSISNARGAEVRLPLYRKLYAVTTATVEYAQLVADTLEGSPSRSKIGRKRARLAVRIMKIVDLTFRVLDQTKRRVFDGESVASKDKIVSLHQPHVDIIVKGLRGTQYGHKIFLSTGKSGLITDSYVGDGNPADSGEAVPTIERVANIFGAVAREAAFDGGYASAANLEALKQAGVEEVAFHKRPGLRVADMTSSPAIYKRLRNFRAGIEGTISWLKGTFGVRRCLVLGRASFNAYLQTAVLAANLVLLARLDCS